MQSTTQSFYSRSDDAVIRVYDVTDNTIETHQHAGEFAIPAVEGIHWPPKRLANALFPCFSPCCTAEP
jgi:hypothetical protein